MAPPAPTVWLTTLGCSKNQVDSDKLEAMLDGAGYLQAVSPESADVVMVNTCAFIEAARQESVDTILEIADAKRDDAKLVVLGCMAQRYETELRDALPEADAVIGLERYGELVPELDRMTTGTGTAPGNGHGNGHGNRHGNGWQPLLIRPAPVARMDILYQVERPTPSTPYAYVKVAEGCDKPCTFCAIPLFRGKQRSRPADNIRDEIVSLAATGVGEVVLVAQDLAAYGRDLNRSDSTHGGGIVELLRLVSDVEGLRRLRLFYLYPKEIRPALIEEMASNPVVTPYFDLSLQHASAGLLRAMKRPGSGQRHLDLIASIREAAPDAALRSSFIVGFPGETDDDVDELAEFLEAADLDWAGFFPYSAEEGTPAANLPGQIPEEEALGRLRRLQDIQDDLTALHNARQTGRRLEVLIDQVEDGSAVGRSYREAPEIDGVIVLDRGSPGDWVSVDITGAYGNDLVGVVRAPSDPRAGLIVEPA